MVLAGSDGFCDVPRNTQHRGHARVNARADALATTGIGPRFYRAAFADHDRIISRIKPNGRRGGGTVAVIKTVPLKLQRHRLGGGDDRGRRVIGADEFLLTNAHAANLVFADHFVRPPAHALGLRVLEGLAVDNHAAVQHTRVLVKLPAAVIVAFAGVLGAAQLTLKQTHAATAQIVMERMRQPNRLVLHKLPARVKAADVIGDIARHEPMLAPLHLLLQPVTVIGEWRLFAGKQVHAHHGQ